MILIIFIKTTWKTSQEIQVQITLSDRSQYIDYDDQYTLTATCLGLVGFGGPGLLLQKELIPKVGCECNYGV